MMDAITQAQAHLDAARAATDRAMALVQERLPPVARPTRIDAVVVKRRGALRRLLRLGDRKRVLRGDPYPPKTPRGWVCVGLVKVPEGASASVRVDPGEIHG